MSTEQVPAVDCSVAFLVLPFQYFFWYLHTTEFRLGSEARCIKKLNTENSLFQVALFEAATSKELHWPFFVRIMPITFFSVLSAEYHPDWTRYVLPCRIVHHKWKPPLQSCIEKPVTVLQLLCHCWGKLGEGWDWFSLHQYVSCCYCLYSDPNEGERHSM